MGNYHIHELKSDLLILLGGGSNGILKALSKWQVYSSKSWLFQIPYPNIIFEPMYNLFTKWFVHMYFIVLQVLTSTIKCMLKFKYRYKYITFRQKVFNYKYCTYTQVITSIKALHHLTKSITISHWIHKVWFHIIADCSYSDFSLLLQGFLWWLFQLQTDFYSITLNSCSIGGSRDIP